MKFKCGLTQEEIAARCAWHAWFAWFPVRVDVGDCRWLETVKRKGTPLQLWGEGDWKYEYRASVE